MKVAIASSSLLTVPTIEKTLESDHEISLFITMPDRPQRRSGTPRPNDFREFVSRKYPHIPNLAPGDDHELVEAIKAHNVELAIALAYGRIIKRDALLAPRYGWINLHFSLLPQWRGAAPLQRALLAGEEMSGVSVFQLDEGMDTGPIYRSREVLLDESKMATEILQDMATIGAGEVVATLEMMKSGKAPTIQQGSVSLAPKISKEELTLKRGSSLQERINQIRAFGRRPGVWFSFQGKRLIVTSASQSDTQVPSDCLQQVDESLLLGCDKGSIEILTLIIEGKREMSGLEFARGRNLLDPIAIEFP